MPLGKGLGSLIPHKTIQKVAKQSVEQTGEQVVNVLAHQIEANPEQPRKNFSRIEMEELINSIQEYGIIQPLIISKIDENKYQIIAGERRWRAAKFLEMETVPCIIRSIQNNQKLEIALIENIQRKDLNPIEKAVAYKRLIDEFNLGHEQVGKKLGKSRSSIANTLRLLTLPEMVQAAIEQEKITEGHAKALLSTNDKEQQKIYLRRILGLGLTVRETEKMILKKRNVKTVEHDPGILEKEQQLSNVLGTKVKIKKQGKKSKIIIDVYDDNDLQRIIGKIIE